MIRGASELPGSMLWAHLLPLTSQKINFHASRTF